MTGPARQRLNDAAFDNRTRKGWTARGSRRYLWDAAVVTAAVDYTLDGQGGVIRIAGARRARIEIDMEARASAFGRGRSPQSCSCS